MITTTGLTKRYGRVLAVDGVDLGVRQGDRYGLLGPNGSGKTTLIRLLLGLVFATSGEIEVLGEPVPRRLGRCCRRSAALVEGAGRVRAPVRPDQPGAVRRGRPGSSRRTRRARIDEALERVGLAGIDRRPVRAYSLGMRQRLGLAGALLRTPRLLVLDEPTNGLDPHGIREIRDLLTELNRDGTTMLLSSHLLAEVEQLCTRVGVMDRGRLVLQDELAALRAPTGRVVVHTPDADRAVALLDGRVEQPGRGPAPGPPRRPGGAERRAGGRRPAGRRDRSERRTLEEVVLATSGGSDRVDGTPGALRRARAGGRRRAASMIRGRAGQAVPPSPHLGEHRAAVRAAGAGGGLPGGHQVGPRPG